MYAINRKTALKTIRNIVAHDFGVIITNSDAKQMRDDICRGVGALSSYQYLSTVTGGISEITVSGVRKDSRWYSRTNWNADKSAVKVTPLQEEYVELATKYIKYYGYQTPPTKKQALQDYYDLAGGNDYEWALTNETAEAFTSSGQSIIEFAQNRANDLAEGVINAIPVGGENGFTFEEIRDVLLEDVDTLYRAILYWLEEKQIQ